MASIGGFAGVPVMWPMAMPATPSRWPARTSMVRARSSWPIARPMDSMRRMAPASGGRAQPAEVAIMSRLPPISGPWARPAVVRAAEAMAGSALRTIGPSSISAARSERSATGLSLSSASLVRAPWTLVVRQRCWRMSCRAVMSLKPTRGFGSRAIASNGRRWAMR